MFIGLSYIHNFVIHLIFPFFHTDCPFLPSLKHPKMFSVSDLLVISHGSFSMRRLSSKIPTVSLLNAMKHPHQNGC